MGQASQGCQATTNHHLRVVADLASQQFRQHSQLSATAAGFSDQTLTHRAGKPSARLLNSRVQPAFWSDLVCNAIQSLFSQLTSFAHKLAFDSWLQQLNQWLEQPRMGSLMHGAHLQTKR